MSFGNSGAFLLLTGIHGGADSGSAVRPIGSRPGCMRSAQFRLFPAPAPTGPVPVRNRAETSPVTCYSSHMLRRRNLCSNQLERRLFSGRSRSGERAARPVIFTRTGQTGENPKPKDSACRREKPPKCARRSGEREAPAALWVPDSPSYVRFSGRMHPPAGARSSIPRALPIPVCPTTTAATPPDRIAP